MSELSPDELSMVSSGTYPGCRKCAAQESEQTSKHATCDTYRCDLLVTAALHEEIGGRVVTCFSIDADIYGRNVANYQVSGRDLCDAMVRRGFAIAYLGIPAKHVDAEVDARRASRGCGKAISQKFSGIADERGCE